MHQLPKDLRLGEDDREHPQHQLTVVGVLKECPLEVMSGALSSSHVEPALEHSFLTGLKLQCFPGRPLEQRSDASSSSGAGLAPQHPHFYRPAPLFFRRLATPSPILATPGHCGFIALSAISTPVWLVPLRSCNNRATPVIETGFIAQEIAQVVDGLPNEIVGHSGVVQGTCLLQGPPSCCSSTSSPSPSS